MATKPLIIAEKPSAARAIAEALGGFTSRTGYMESAKFLLTWAIGHLVEQMSPEEYDPRWKRWSLQSLPIMPTTFGVKVVSKTKSQFEIIARLARSAPELINACDAGREGELIFRYICQAAKIERPARRLWVSSLTREAIRQAFAALRPEGEYNRLYQSALCRARGDWLVGMNATRAFTVKWDELLSVGRVQTPTLALLVKREREITAFVPEDYWEVFADFATPDGRAYRGKWFGPDGDRLKTAAAAEAIAARVQKQPGVIEQAEEKPVTERPPQLYDLTSLQRDANRRFGLTAAATLKAAQSLYESKLITYPRTDSRYLTRDMVKGLGRIVGALSGVAEFREAAQGAELGRVSPGNRRVVDDSKVTDHHAIIPTAEAPRSLTGVGAKVYGLIARRFLAQFYPDARFMTTEVVTRVSPEGDRFRSRGRRVVEPGWRVVEPEPPRKKAEAEEESAALPLLRAGEPVSTRKAKAEKKATQPPKRYTEAALLSAMEFAGKEMDDEALKEAMKGHGLGTPATRAAIIERLKDVGYVDLVKKQLVPTEKGHRLVTLAEAAGAQVLLSPELTGEWEKRIADIQAGAYEPERFMGEIQGLATQVVELVQQASGGGDARSKGGQASGSEARSRGGRAFAGPGDSEDAQGKTAGKCPRCGGRVIRGTRDWACSNPDCTVRIPTWLCSKVIDERLAASLLTQGRTPLITGFKSPRTGKSFSAYLLLSEGKVAFEFPPNRPHKSAGKRGTRTRRSPDERATAAETGSRKTGRSTTRATGPSKRSTGTRMGGRASGPSESARTKPGRD